MVKHSMEKLNGIFFRNIEENILENPKACPELQI